MPAILADLVIALLLNSSPRGGRRAALAYLLNPVTFLLSVYHGQLHTAATAGAVLALWAADRGQGGLSGVALGAAVSIRHHFGLLIAPLLLRFQAHRCAIALAFGLIVVLANAPLLGSYRSGRLAAPIWVYGAWGYTMLLQQGPRVLELIGLRGASSMVAGVNTLMRAAGPAVYWAWAAVFAAWTWRRARQGTLTDAWRAALFFLVGQYAISPGFGVQWLIWALPFWLIVDAAGAVRYSVLAGVFLAGSYWQASLNAKYALGSITAHLPLLSPVDLAGVLLVGIAGLLTWGYCVRAAWRLAWT